MTTKRFSDNNIKSKIYEIKELIIKLLNTDVIIHEIIYPYSLKIIVQGPPTYFIITESEKFLVDEENNIKNIALLEALTLFLKELKLNKLFEDKCKTKSIYSNKFNFEKNCSIINIKTSILLKLNITFNNLHEENEYGIIIPENFYMLSKFRINEKKNILQNIFNFEISKEFPFDGIVKLEKLGIINLNESEILCVTTYNEKYKNINNDNVFIVRLIENQINFNEMTEELNDNNDLESDIELDILIKNLSWRIIKSLTLKWIELEKKAEEKYLNNLGNALIELLATIECFYISSSAHIFKIKIDDMIYKSDKTSPKLFNFIQTFNFKILYSILWKQEPTFSLKYTMFDELNIYQGKTPSYSQFYGEEDYLYIKYDNYGWFRYSNKTLSESKLNNDTWIDCKIINIETNRYISPNFNEVLPNKIIKFINGKPIISLIKLKVYNKSYNLKYAKYEKLEEEILNSNEVILNVEYSNNIKKFKRSHNENSLGWELVENQWYPVQYSEKYKTLLFSKKSIDIYNDDQIYYLPKKIINFLKFRSLINLVPNTINKTIKDNSEVYIYQHQFNLILRGKSSIYWQEKENTFVMLDNIINNSLELYNNFMKSNIKILCYYYRINLNFYPYLECPEYIKKVLNNIVNLSHIQKNIEYNFNNIIYLIEALTHSTCENFITPSQCKLVIVGKALIKYILIETNLSLSEDINIIMGKIALTLNLNKFILSTEEISNTFNKEIFENYKYLLADTFFAIIGAILIDGKWNMYTFIKEFVKKKISESNDFIFCNDYNEDKNINYKLIECKYCDKKLNSEKQLIEHCSSAKHLKNVKNFTTLLKNNNTIIELNPNAKEFIPKEFIPK